MIPTATTNTITLNSDRTVTVEFDLVTNAQDGKSNGGESGGCFMSITSSDCPVTKISFLTCTVNSPLRIPDFSEMKGSYLRSHYYSPIYYRQRFTRSRGAHVFFSKTWRYDHGFFCRTDGS